MIIEMKTYITEKKLKQLCRRNKSHIDIEINEISKNIVSNACYFNFTIRFVIHDDKRKKIFTNKDPFKYSKYVRL